MANSTEHISIRLPKALVDELRRESQVEQRSLAWVVARRLQMGVPSNALPTPDRIDLLVPGALADAAVSFTACGADLGNVDVRTALDDVAAAAVKAMSGGQVELPRLSQCPSCSSELVTWGAGKRCMNCQRNW